MQCLAAHFRGPHGIVPWFAAELRKRTVTHDQHHRPYKICREATPQHHHQHRQVLPEVQSSTCQQMLLRHCCNRRSGRQSKREERTHHAGKHCHRQAANQREVGLTRLDPLFRRHLPLFRPASEAVDRDRNEAHQHTEQDYLPRPLMHDGVNRPAVDRRDQCPERRAQAEGDGVAQCNPEIAYRQAEREAADTPKRSEHDRVGQG